MDKVCLIGGLRSYIGLTGGVYRHVPAELLGAAVLKAVTEKSLKEDRVPDDV